jgi:formylmethanofuran dehydrogenase subunit E
MILTPGSFSDHIKVNPGHYEVRRWTFPVQKDEKKFKELKIETKRITIEHIKQTHQYTRIIFGVSRCRKCGVILTKENTIPSAVRNKQYVCSECMRKYHREYRSTHKARIRIIVKQEMENNEMQKM